RTPGSARVPRVGESVSLSQTLKRLFQRDAETNTRDACATRKIVRRVVPKQRYHPIRKLRQLIPLHRALPFYFATQMGLGEQRTKIGVAETACHQHRQYPAVFHR